MSHANQGKAHPDALGTETTDIDSCFIQNNYHEFTAHKSTVVLSFVLLSEWAPLLSETQATPKQKMIIEYPGCAD